jgi:hypothetical protein
MSQRITLAAELPPRLLPEQYWRIRAGQPFHDALEFIF